MVRKISHKSGDGGASLRTARAAEVARICPTGKLGWLTKADAKRHARKYNNRARRFYRCDRCGAWHATSMTYADQIAAGIITYGEGQ
jgi:hypothetical protein